jgi:hypothetical protein
LFTKLIRNADTEETASARAMATFFMAEKGWVEGKGKAEGAK